MTLQELMYFEEQLLICENNNKFIMPFADYVVLDNLLSEIEKITNLYFYLIDMYKMKINKEDITNEDRINKLKKYNTILLNEEIEINFEQYKHIIDKYVEKK